MSPQLSRYPVFAVEDSREGIEALAAEAQHQINAFLSTNSLRKADLVSVSLTPVSTVQVTPEEGSVRDIVDRQPGLLVTILHAAPDPFGRG